MPVIVANGSYSSSGYVAPTVYLIKGGSVPRWNYYNSFAEAAAAFIDPSTLSPAGSVSFTNNGQPQTFGINVDFYTLINGKWTPVDYAYMKNNNTPNGVIRFYTVGGNGAFFASFNRNYFGISATVVANYSAEKLAALDSFYREVALLKYRYNALVGFLNSLAARQLNTREQQIFNEGILKLQNMSNQISTIEGLEITYTDKGAVVGFPIILIIAIILILASAAAWSVVSILSEKEKTKRINDAFDLSKWIAEKKLQVSQEVAAGTLTQSQGNSIFGTLDNAAALANKVATESTKQTESAFGSIATIAKWGVIGLLVIEGSKLLKRPGNGSN